MTGELGQNRDDKPGQDNSVRRVVDKVAGTEELEKNSWDRTSRT